MTLNSFLRVWQQTSFGVCIIDNDTKTRYFDGPIYELMKSDVDLSMEIISIDILDNHLVISVYE